MDNKQFLRLLRDGGVDYDPKPAAYSQSLETPTIKPHKHSTGQTIGSRPPSPLVLSDVSDHLSVSKVPKAQKLIKKKRKSARITTIILTDVSDFRKIVQQYTGLNSPLHCTAHHSTRILKRLSSLRVFDFSNTKLMNLPDLSEAKHLRTLVLQHCTNLVEVSSIQYLTNLKYLNLKGCTSLRSLPSLMNLKLLHSLDLSYCSNLVRLPLSIGCLSSLTTLDLKACKRLQNLPLSTVKPKSLQSLNISGCLKLVKLISDIGMAEKHLKLRPQVPSSSSEPELQSKILEAILLEQNVTPRCLGSSALLEGNVGSHVTKYKELPLLERIVTKIDPQAARQISAGSEDGTQTSLTVESAITLVESETAKNFQLKEQKPTSAQVATHKETQKPLKNRDSRTQPLNICDLQKQMRKLESYIGMSVEEIHQLDVFGNVEKIIHTLFGQTSCFKEWTNIEQIICFLEELKNNIPHTMLSVKSARNYRILLEGKLTQLVVSLDEAEKQYKVLDTEMIVLCEEEAKLEIETQALLARREELLDQRISHASC